MADATPIYTTTINHCRVRFFRSPVSDAELCWVCMDDLHQVVAYAAPGRVEVIQRLEAGELRGAFALVRCTGRQVVIARYVLAEDRLGTLAAKRWRTKWREQLRQAAQSAMRQATPGITHDRMMDLTRRAFDRPENAHAQ